MGLFDRVEARLASSINGAFARAFKAEVQPVEIGAAIRKAMDDKAAILSADRAIVPNRFIIELAPSDHERLTAYAAALTEELVAAAEEHIAGQHYRPAGPITITFDKLGTLETGVFRVRSSSEPGPRGASHGAVRSTSTGPRRQGEVIETHHSSEDPAWRVPRNQPFPPEATAEAQGPVRLAGNAASAAAGAAAGTAAAAGRMWASQARNDHPEYTDDERAAQRRRDLSAWGDDERPRSAGAPGPARAADPARGAAPAASSAAGTAPDAPAAGYDALGYEPSGYEQRGYDPAAAWSSDGPMYDRFGEAGPAYHGRAQPAVEPYGSARGDLRPDLDRDRRRRLPAARGDQRHRA